MKTVHIKGMMCQHCAARVRKALGALDANAEVILDQEIAKIDSAVQDDAIRKAVTDAGYEVTAID